ncbi:MAG: pilus assembly protein PilM [Elusimicrobia bacterium]|nr:pilus assembly protein PilM [Elusimicrobiota bacterium]
MSGGIDQLIDTLVFGKPKPTSGPCIGLYLSPEVIYIAETRSGPGGGVVVDHLVRVPIPIDGKSAAGTLTMSTDFLSDPLKVAGLIRQSMSQIRWNSKNVVVTLSHHLGLLRYFPMPRMERRFLRTSVPIEAKKYIPIPFDALAHDFQAGPMPPDAAGKPRLGVLIAVTQNKNLANVSGLLAALGLNLVGLEVAPCSVLRLWQAVEPARGPEPFVHAHFDGGSVRIMICDRGLPVFFREVFMGAAASLDDQRKVDMTGCLSFARKQLGLTGVSRITLSGAPAALGPWKDAFAAETGVPADIQDTAKLLSIKGGDWGGYAAIGASARASASSAAAIDLAAKDRISEDEHRAARDIIAAGMALAALIAGAGVLEMLTYSRRAKKLDEYRVAPDVQAALQGLPPAQIEAKLLEMSDQLAAQRRVMNERRWPLSLILRKILEAMPENIWLVDIAASHPLAGEGGALGLTLRGRVRGATAAEEQDAARRFKDVLLRDPTLAPLFDAQLTLTGRPPSAQENASGQTPEALARGLEERTEFTIELKGKGKS